MITFEQWVGLYLRWGATGRDLAVIVGTDLVINGGLFVLGWWLRSVT